MGKWIGEGGEHEVVVNLTPECAVEAGERSKECVTHGRHVLECVTELRVILAAERSRYARLARQVEGLRTDLRRADETVSALHTLLWDQQRNAPRVDGANDLIWLLHVTLRSALAAAAPLSGGRERRKMGKSSWYGCDHCYHLSDREDCCKVNTRKKIFKCCKCGYIKSPYE